MQCIISNRHLYTRAIAQAKYSRLRSIRRNDILPVMTNSLHPCGTIALLSNPEHQALREKISGVYSAATRCGWQVFQTAQLPTAANIRKIRSSISPIGFIIDPLQLTQASHRESFGKIPVVLLSRDYNRSKQVFDCSCQDIAQPVNAAVDVFKAFGHFASFGFIGHPSKQAWSRDRGTLFGKRTSGMAAFFEYSGRDPERSDGNRQLVKWLRRLPKPCGLFLATDHLAPSVFNAIHKAGIDIPGEIAVASVDDIREICLNVTPEPHKRKRQLLPMRGKSRRTAQAPPP